MYNDNFNENDNTKSLVTNRYRNSNLVQLNGNRKIEDCNSSSESSSETDSDDSSSSGEFVLLEDYTTLKPEVKNKNFNVNSLKTVSNSKTNKSVNHPLFQYKTKSLPVIFERSDESSVGSQSTIELSQDDDDSTISDCSNSSSSIIITANEKQPTNLKETENLTQYTTTHTTTNSHYIGDSQQHHRPITIERNHSIDLTDKLSSVIVHNNDLPMYDSLSGVGDQNSVCDNHPTALNNNTHTQPDSTHQNQLISMREWTKTDATKQQPQQSSSFISQSELIFSKRTPRFPVKQQPYHLVETDPQSENNSADTMHNNRYQKNKPVKKLLNKDELITDLDDLLEPNSRETDLPRVAEDMSSCPVVDRTTDDRLPVPQPQPGASYFKNQMFKNFSKSDLKITSNNNDNNNNSSNKRPETVKVDVTKSKPNETVALLSSPKDSPSKRSQELVGNVVKMDKTISRVTNDIVRIDNAIDRLSQFNRNVMANLELMSDAELTSDIETQSVGAQTETIGQAFPDRITKQPEKVVKPPGKVGNQADHWDSSDSSDSSTEKESNSESDDSVALKPSPVHQIIDKPVVNPMNSSPGSKSPRKPIITAKIPPRKPDIPSSLNHQESDLSSLPESSICEDPENRDLVNKVKYFQRQIKKSAGLYKKPPNVEPPSRLVVDESSSKIKSPHRPIPKPRNSIDSTLTRHTSNSSSESSNYDYNSRTLSNSNNHNQISPSPVNSDSGSIISLNSNHFERRFQKGAGASARYNSKTRLTDKWGTGSRMSHRGKMEEECGSLSGKNSANKIPIKSLMNPSRSYNSLNVLNSLNPDERSRSGSLAVLNKDYQDITALCDLIQRNLNLNNHDRIKGIFSALITDNEHDKIEEIIDHFAGDDRALLLEIVNDIEYGIKDSESIFDMTMSRTDLRNHLRPGISMSSISDVYYQHNIDNEKMVYWRADIEELLPPPMKPPPNPMPTNLLKSAIISPESLQFVDNKVLEVLLLEPTTFTELVNFLTRDCSKDVEKVRALFRWITMYDIKSINFDPVAPSDTLIGILRAIKCGQMSYNELFFRMCRYAGIHCQFISGYSKGAGYRPGMAIKDNRMFKNVWTAVYVAGAWRFVNCNWGARYLTSRHQDYSQTGKQYYTINSQSLELKHRCDEFYFLTDAKQHIFEHFPDKKRWQLLNRPITLEQFMALPIVKSPFFNANLSFKRNYAEILQTKKGKVTVKLNMPQAVGVSVKLENRADGSILRGLTLVRILDNQMIMVTAAPSQPGKFYLSIYVNDDWKSEDNMEMACSFQVHCSEHNYDRLVTGRFPDVGVLGATPAAQNLGIITNPGIDPFVIWEERSTLKLNVTISPGLRVGHKMMSYDRSGQNSAPCDSYALLQYHTQGRSQYHLRFPIEGFYCLTIYAGGEDHHIPDTEPMECIYRILIDCKRAQERIPPFPRQTSRWVGFKLIEPICQHLELNTAYRFKILAVQCSSVCVVINNIKWIDLSPSNDGLWKGKINTGQELENLSVYGKFGNEEDDEFIKLLDFILIPKNSK